MTGHRVGPTENEADLLRAAQQGDQRAFEAVLAPYRNQLHTHCYRLLGSVHDADDALQETLMRAWRGLAGYQGRSSLRVWLFKIATNACLKLIAKHPKRVLSMDFETAAMQQISGSESSDESTWLEPYPDKALGVEDGYTVPEANYEQRESIELAFIAAVQHLSGRQRAVLILRDVLGFSANEVAESLNTTAASVNGVLNRARKAVSDRVPQQSQQHTLRALGNERQRQLVSQYMGAWETGDIGAVVAMLTYDAKWSMPHLATLYRGLDEITAFLGETISQGWRHIATQANGQLAVGCYLWNPTTRSYMACVLDVLTLDGERIKAVTSFVTPEIFPQFGMPREIAA
jgi:RNA polymerase sigma-70 factor (ECF subfamily)